MERYMDYVTSSLMSSILSNEKKQLIGYYSHCLKINKYSIWVINSTLHHPVNRATS